MSVVCASKSETRPDAEEQSASFDPEHSELESNPEKLRNYVSMLESALGHHAEVVGILEIGSYAKGEAVRTSDIDTRVYVRSPNAYLFNAFRPQEQAQPLYESFIEAYGFLPRWEYLWDAFNDPVSLEISEHLPSNIEFGFVDQRYAEFELKSLDQFPSIEHSLLFQSNVLYDPHGFLRRKRQELKGRIFAPLVRFYRERFLDQLSGRIYRFLEPHFSDRSKIERSGQIIWVQQAVRCLRNAVASKMYISTGAFLYRKAGVLGFYRQYLPDDLAFVRKLYEWKTNPQVRENMVKAFVRDEGGFFEIFREAMPQLEAIVSKVADLELDLEDDLSEAMKEHQDAYGQGR